MIKRLDSFSKWIRQKFFQNFYSEKIKKKTILFFYLYFKFEKIPSLKIWWLISFWDIKSHFCEITLKWCIFKHDIFYLHQYFPLILTKCSLYCIYSHLSNKRDVTLTNFGKFHPTQNKNPPCTFIYFITKLSIFLQNLMKIFLTVILSYKSLF